MPATVPSPAKRTNSWLRTTEPPVVYRNSLKRACPPIAEDQRPVAHEGGVERDRDVIVRHRPAEMGADAGVVIRERGRHRADGEALLQAIEIGELAHEGAIDEHDPARLDRLEHRAG